MLNRLFVQRYLLSRTRGSVVRVIAIISVVGVTLGVAAMITVLSVMQGFNKSMEARLLGVEPHIVFSKMDKFEAEKIQEQLGDRGQITAYEKQDVIVRTGEGVFEGAIAEGVSEDRMQEIFHKRAPGTEGLNSDLRPKEILVGLDLARKLGVWEGDTLTIIAPESLVTSSSGLPVYEKVKVAGTFQSEVNEVDSQAIFYTSGVGLQKLEDSASLEKGYEVRLLNPQDAPKIKTELSKITTSPISTWEEMNSTLFYALKMEKVLMSLFLGLVVLVGSFSVVAVLSLLVMEKRTDMGILKALGATKKQVRSLFLSLGLSIGGLGLSLGLGLGLLLCSILKVYKFSLPDIYYDQSIPVDVQPGVVLSVLLLGFLLITLGALAPANKISDLKPIDVIRRE